MFDELFNHALDVIRRSDFFEWFENQWMMNNNEVRAQTEGFLQDFFSAVVCTEDAPYVPVGRAEEQASIVIIFLKTQRSKISKYVAYIGKFHRILSQTNLSPSFEVLRVSKMVILQPC